MVTTPLEWRDLGTINTTDNAGGDDDQNQVKVVQLENGNLLYVWTSDADPASGPGSTSGRDLIGQLYDPLGNAVGGEFQISIATDNGHFDADVTALDGGGFMVTYTTFENSLDGSTDIKATVFDNTGSLTQSFDVDDGFNTVNGESQVASVSASSALVAYRTTGGIAIQVWNPSTGNQQLSETIISNASTTIGEPYGWDVAALDNGTYAVVISNRNSPANDVISFQRFDEDGSTIGSSTIVSNLAQDAYDPSITALTDGRFVMSYTIDGSGGTNTGIRFRVYNDDGTADTAQLNPLTTTAGNQTLSEVVALDNGQFLIAWYDENTNDINGQRFSASGNKIGVEFDIENYGSSTVESISLTRLADGRIAVGWTENVNGAGNQEIQGEIWDARDNANAQQEAGYQIGTRLGDDFFVDAGAIQVYGYLGNDRIHVDSGDLGTLNLIDGGLGLADVVELEGTGTLDLRNTNISGIEILEFGSASDQIAQLSNSQLNSIPSISFSTAPGANETLEIFLTLTTSINLATININNFSSSDGDLIRVFGDNTNETITGSAFNDELNGGGGNDTLSGGLGNDVLIGGGGIDSFDGGGGIDTLDYSGPATSTGVTFDMNAGTALFPGLFIENYTNIENLIATQADDTIFEETGVANVIDGDGGNDTIFVSSNIGEDSFIGGSGFDTLDWSGNTQSNLVFTITNTVGSTGVLGSVTDGVNGGVSTTFAGIESIVGTNQGDVFIASDLGDTFFGLNGDDFANSGTGDDVLDGGNQGAEGDTVGFRVDFFLATGVTFDLGITGQQDTIGAGLDTISNFENIFGTSFDDTLTGDAGANVIQGHDGDDMIFGGGGDDLIYGDRTTGLGPGGDDIINPGAGIDVVNGGKGNDTYIAEAGYGGGVGETFNGGFGTDTIDVSALSLNGSYTLLGAGLFEAGLAGSTGNITLINVENVNAGDGNDTIIGGAGVNFLNGNGGNDIIVGEAGNDVFDGGDGFDTLNYDIESGILGVVVNLNTKTATDTFGDTDTVSSFESVIGTDQADILIGDDDDNVLEGGVKDDIIDGGDNGAGGDTASYASAASAVTVDLNLQGNAQETGGANIDTLTGIENLTGSDFNDTLTGDANANVLSGGDGDDILVGGRGDDTLDGGNDGAGGDTADYSSALTAVNVDLNIAGPQNTGGAGFDTLVNIENLTGSNLDDTLIGDGNINVIYGGSGNDTITGGGGVDTLDGGEGEGDTVDYTGTTTAFDVNLETGVTSFFTETAVNFENINIGDGDNVVIGTGGVNIINGGGGNDTLNGMAGNDTLNGDDGNDFLVGGTGADNIDGGAGSDYVSYVGSSAGVTVNLGNNAAFGGDAQGDTLSNIENLAGSAFNDVLVGDAGNNTLRGENGNDYLLDLSGGDDIMKGGAGDDRLQGSGGADSYFGGSGTDEVRYNNSGAAVTVNLRTGIAVGGDATGDMFDSVEDLVGSQFNDTLIGDDGVNRLEGFLGDDFLRGGGGADVLWGGLGFDTASYLDSAVGVDARLLSTGSGGDAEGDTLIYMEGISGSNFNDTLVGGGATVTLSGEMGNDILFDYSANATLNGGFGNDFMQGGIGGDAYDGGFGTDTVSFANAVGPVTANLATGLGTNNDALGDTYTSVENLLGSANSDTFIGDDNDNNLNGQGGIDFLMGGLGNDTLTGGAGVDLFQYDTTTWGSDIITDFQNGTDFIDLRGSGLTFADFTEVATGSGMRLDYTNGGGTLSSISLLGINIADIDAGDFLI